MLIGLKYYTSPFVWGVGESDVIQYSQSVFLVFIIQAWIVCMSLSIMVHICPLHIANIDGKGITNC